MVEKLNVENTVNLPGAIYSKVPQKVLARPALTSDLANPKSVKQRWPSFPMRTFSGFLYFKKNHYKVQ